MHRAEGIKHIAPRKQTDFDSAFACAGQWAVDFQTEPPPEDEEWEYGVYHMGFRTALGLGPDLASDSTSKVE